MTTRNVPVATGPAGQEPHVHQWCPGTTLPDHERQVAERTEHQEPSGGRGQPSHVSGVDERVDDRAGRPGHQQRTDDVEPGIRRDRAAPRQHAGEGQGDGQADGHVEVEDPGPTGSGGQDSAQKYAERRSATPERRPHAERLVAFVSVEERDDKRQCGRREQRRTDALCDAAAEQHGRRLGHAGDHRRHREGHQADEHHALGAHEVGETATEEKHAAERQRVGADRPRQCRTAEGQFALHVG